MINDTVQSFTETPLCDNILIILLPLGLWPLLVIANELFSTNREMHDAVGFFNPVLNHNIFFNDEARTQLSVDK